MDFKIALIEIGGSHEANLLTQMKALKSIGVQVTLICTLDIKERNPHFEKYVDAILVVGFTGKAWKDLKLMTGVNEFLSTNHFSKVIVNTAQGGHIRNLCMTAPKKIEFYGIIHKTSKFKGSFNQNMISRKIKKYLVLSDFLLDNLDIPKGLQIQSFYPLDYPRFDFKLEKPADETWIAIIDGVEKNRKDLKGFVRMIRQINDEKVKFIFLDNTDLQKSEETELKSMLQSENLLNRVVFFDNLISPEFFDAYLAHTDFLCPLIHPNLESAELPFSNQISGAFNLAFSYRIPLLMHRVHATIPDLKNASFFYELNDFRQILERAIETRSRKVEAIRNVEKWHKDFQRQNLLMFLDLK